ncbi:MAG TPA: hypothetical protein ENH75_10875 [archaeon]|nr:hypothetical protein [archaeon]
MSQNNNQLIIVDIIDYEHAILDGSSTLKEITGKGILVVKNPTQRSRLWNLICDVKEIENTSVETRELNVGTLNPSQEFKKEYDIRDLKEPCLKVEEIFDADRSDPGKINNTFLFLNDNKGMLRLILDNMVDVPILEIKLVRDMPDFIQEIELPIPDLGDLSLKVEDGKRILYWEIPSLDSKKKIELDIPFTVNMKDRKEQTLGVLNVKYLVNNHKLTIMNPEVRGLTDSMSGIDRDESSIPGKWECNVEFINESEFQVRLENVRVAQTITTGIETCVSQTPNKVINPEEFWDFDFQVEEKDVPELSSEIVFTPLYVVIPRVIGEITKKATIYTVLSATIDKGITPPEVDAYANTDMTIVNTIVNNGSSSISRIFVTDDLPSDFVPPLVNDIKITVGGIDISSREEFVRNISLVPMDQNPDINHQIICDMANLKDEFLPDKKMIVSYPLKARNPRPPTETNYMTPVKIEINSPLEGKLLVKSPDEEPEIKVKYVKRKLKTLKSIKPGLSDGDFSISVRVLNKGDVELENVLIRDIIPSGFSLTEFTPPAGATHEIVSVGDNNELQINVAEIRGGASVSINYNCTGSGEYPRSEPKIIVGGRGGSDRSERPDTGPQKAHIEDSQAGKLHDIFIDLYKAIDRAPTGAKLGDLLEDQRDILPPGPILHQILALAKEMKALGDKIIVGSTRDNVLNKLQEFKSKYS